ncbi:hypothetical protein R3P38DRAFT_3206273 [Favolaschia claudopus]|uniref:Uncharacterized protein n=1 Tax=Favolaschia claudopus TaxID=2862362 RepID=A0AAW0ALQ1_9AGAR
MFSFSLLPPPPRTRTTPPFSFLLHIKPHYTFPHLRHLPLPIPRLAIRGPGSLNAGALALSTALLLLPPSEPPPRFTSTLINGTDEAAPLPPPPKSTQ